MAKAYGNEVSACTKVQSITSWFNENDPYFERPFSALKAGYTLVELCGEYHRTYAPEFVFGYWLADYRKYNYS